MQREFEQTCPAFLDEDDTGAKTSIVSKAYDVKHRLLRG
jgi:hypothetical protein